MRFHLTDDGPRECRAFKRPCPLGGEHFNSLRDAENAFGERHNEVKITKNRNRAGEESAVNNRAYAHWSIINDHLHNAGGTGNPAEVQYYSSPQGRLELERRLRNRYNQDYLNILEKIKANEKFDYSLNESYIEQQVIEGEKHIPRSFNDAQKGIDTKMADNEALQHYLVEKSSEWLSNLTPEEQESVSWLTSNGFRMAQYGAGCGEVDRTLFENIVDENAIYAKHPTDYKKAEKEIIDEQTKYARAYLNRVNKAVTKAPKLGEPVVISRGTTVHEVLDLLGSTESDTKKLFEDLSKGKFNETIINRDARIRKMPLSASANPNISNRFSERTYGKDFTDGSEVVILVKTRSFASPVNVSAWSSGEYEVFTNPDSDYVIKGAVYEKDRFILEIEETG